MRTALAAAILLLVSTASAETSMRYRVLGPCRVRTTEGPAYDKTVQAELDVAISGPDDAVRLELSSKRNATCVLRGKRAGATITLLPGQKCPQKVDDGLAHGELIGVLQSGRATSNGASVAVVTNWKLEGDVKVLFRTIHMKGTLDTNLVGKRRD